MKVGQSAGQVDTTLNTTQSRRQIAIHPQTSGTWQKLPDETRFEILLAFLKFKASRTRVKQRNVLMRTRGDLASLIS